MLATCYGLFYICFNQWARYKANPTVISLETDYRHWNGTMPAITLCYLNKSNRSMVEKYVKRLYSTYLFFLHTHLAYGNKKNPNL